jgi:hypothetical protein
MDVLLMGQLLLGCLLLIALLVNGLLLRLGQQLRHALSEVPGSLNTLLLWAPVGLLAMVLGGAALAEYNLFTFRDAPDTSGISWFMLGACLMIFANVCSAFILIRLKETLSMAKRANDLEMLLPLHTSGRASGEKQTEE